MNRLQSIRQAVFTFWAFSIMAFIPLTTQAGAPTAPSTCDPAFMESLENQAWLEAQRAITMNQNLILKPDSVLEYMCFHAVATDIAPPLAFLFQENPAWGVVVTDLLESFENVFLDDLEDGYLPVNFGHEFGLGHYGGVEGFEEGGVPCGVMNDVWQEAKSNNFIPEGYEDQYGFYTHLEHAGLPDPAGAGPAPLQPDVRAEPAQSEGPGNPVIVTSSNFARNVESALGRPPVDNPAGYVYRETVLEVFEDQVRPCVEVTGECCTILISPNNIVLSPGGGAGAAQVTCPNQGCVPVGGACVPG